MSRKTGVMSAMMAMAAMASDSASDVYGNPEPEKIVPSDEEILRKEEAAFTKQQLSRGLHLYNFGKSEQIKIWASNQKTADKKFIKHLNRNIRNCIYKEI